MRFKTVVAGLAATIFILSLLLQISVPINGLGLAVSPDVLTYKSTGTQNIRIWNLDNSTPMNFTVSFTNNTGSAKLTASPSSGRIIQAQNTTIAITLDAANKTNGSVLMHVNSSAQQIMGGAVLMPSVLVHINYTINDTAPQTSAANGPQWPVIITAFVVFAIVAAGVVYWAWKKR